MVNKRSALEKVFDFSNIVFMIIVFIFMVYPFIYILNYSISSQNTSRIPLYLLPSGLNLATYKYILQNKWLWNALLISVLRSTIGPLVTLIISGSAAYVLSRKDLVGGKFVRLFFMATMYFNAGLIPTYFVVSSLKLTNTFMVYIILTAVFPFFILLLKTYIESIPSSMEEAVVVDGGNEIDAYFRVILPICMPINAAVLMFAAINQWNSLIDTQLYNSNVRELHTLQYFLYGLTSSTLFQSLEEARSKAYSGQVTSETMKMAVAVVTIIPIMCVYPFLQRYFVSGIMIGSVKG